MYKVIFSYAVKCMTYKMSRMHRLGFDRCGVRQWCSGAACEFFTWFAYRVSIRHQTNLSSCRLVCVHWSYGEVYREVYPEAGRVIRISYVWGLRRKQNLRVTNHALAILASRCLLSAIQSTGMTVRTVSRCRFSPIYSVWAALMRYTLGCHMAFRTECSY